MHQEVEGVGAGLCNSLSKDVSSLPIKTVTWDGAPQARTTFPRPLACRAVYVNEFWAMECGLKRLISSSPDA